MKRLIIILLFSLPVFADQVNCVKWKDSSGATVGTYCKPFTIKAGTNLTFSDDQLSRVLTIDVPSIATSTENIRYADQFSGADAGAKIVAAIADLPSTGGVVNAKAFEGAQTISSLITISKPVTILFGYATYTCSVAQCFQINYPGISFVGDGVGRPGPTPAPGGTIFQMTGTGTVIQIGTDNGHPYTDADYDGFEGFRMENIQAVYTGLSTSALTNGFGNYGTNTYFVKDWRGGGQHWRNVVVSNFNYGFWGIQSDINSFYDVMWRQNEVGVYLGPRSDQNDFYSLYALHNDNTVTIDGATLTKFWGGIDNSSGSSSTSAFSLLGTYSSNPTTNTTFTEFWFENSQGQAATAINAFVDIGTGTTAQVTDTYFINPYIIDRQSPNTPRTKYLASMDNGEGLFIIRPQGQQIDSLIEFKGTTSPFRVRIEQDRLIITTPITNSGSGVPQVLVVGQYNVSSAWTMYNRADASFTAFRLRSGVAADQSTQIRFVDRGDNTKFYLEKSSVNNFNIVDSPASINRLALTLGGASSLNSVGATAVNCNVTSGTGTGGCQFGDGAGNVVGSVSSAGLGTFNGGVKVAGAVSPTVAGAQTAGTNALPFSSAFIGAAATNNAQLTGTFTAARIQTLPDITGNVAVYLSASDASVDLASVASAACTSERTVAVTGAAFGDAVDVMAATALEAGSFLTGKVTSSGNIKWQFCNLSGGAIDRASDTYSIRVRK